MPYKVYYAYCSGRDQKVRVVRRSEVLGESRSDDNDSDPSDLVCLEYGENCTGAICPTFQVPSAEMAERLAAAGLLRIVG